MNPNIDAGVLTVRIMVIGGAAGDIYGIRRILLIG